MQPFQSCDSLRNVVCNPGASHPAAILKGLRHSAQGWTAGEKGGGPTLGKRAREALAVLVSIRKVPGASHPAAILKGLRHSAQGWTAGEKGGRSYPGKRSPRTPPTLKGLHHPLIPHVPLVGLIDPIPSGFPSV